MAPPEKIQGKEKEFLETHLPAYYAAAASGTYPAFWPDFFRGYFRDYPAEPIPLPDLSEGEELNVPEEMEDSEVDSDGAPVDATAINRAKAAAAWKKTIIRLREQSDEKRQKWCLGKGVTKKKAVSIYLWFCSLRVLTLFYVATSNLVPLEANQAHPCYGCTCSSCKHHSALRF